MNVWLIEIQQGSHVDETLNIFWLDADKMTEEQKNIVLNESHRLYEGTGCLEWNHKENKNLADVTIVQPPSNKVRSPMSSPRRRSQLRDGIIGKPIVIERIIYLDWRV